MASVASLSPGPKKELSVQEQRWNSAVVRTEKQSEVRWIARKIERNKDRYVTLEKATGVKWEVISCFHNMECSLRFDQHLHNGDPLTKRTVQVPAGRPKTHAPPFTFEESAIDALRYDGMDKVNWNDLNKGLDAIEAYNGLGYKKRGIPSPYLYAATNIEKPGRYIRDRVWSSTAMSDQVGVVAILKELGYKW